MGMCSVTRVHCPRLEISTLPPVKEEVLRAQGDEEAARVRLCGGQE